MSRAEKQQTVLMFLLLKYPKLTLGMANKLLSEWEYRTGNLLNQRG